MKRKIFREGDGEVSFCGAIEMSGLLELKCSIIKGGMKLLPAVGPSPLSVNPIFEIGPLEPRYSEWLVFEGISVDEQGVQHYLDATIAYKRAVLNCIKYLSQFGYSEEQVYLLLSCIPCEGRISGIVDVQRSRYPSDSSCNLRSRRPTTQDTRGACIRSQGCVQKCVHVH